MHSTEFRTPKDLEGKKVVIIGACTSGWYSFKTRQNARVYEFLTAHDIASDCADAGIGTYS